LNFRFDLDSSSFKEKRALKEYHYITLLRSRRDACTVLLVFRGSSFTSDFETKVFFRPTTTTITTTTTKKKKLRDFSLNGKTIRLHRDDDADDAATPTPTPTL